MTPEAVVLVPSYGHLVVRPSGNADWYAKRPGAHVSPLTDQWYTAVTQPIYHADGSTTYVLTPPRDKTGPWLRIAVVAAFIALCALPWVIKWHCECRKVREWTADLRLRNEELDWRRQNTR